MQPKISAARGEMRPAGIGRVGGARHLRVDVAVEPVVDRAGAARGEVAAEAGQQRPARGEGSPATYIVVIVVSSSSDWTFGLVSSR